MPSIIGHKTSRRGVSRCKVSPLSDQRHTHPGAWETALLTSAALLAFAANSILTRLALGHGHMGAAGFTAVRIASGALVLSVLACARTRSWQPLRWQGAAGPLALFAYAAPFSFAYLRIGAAVGALVLFGAVQLTMIGWGIARGERPSGRTWLGLALATGGLLGLTLPAAHRPDPLGVVLMVVAGIAWGMYSLQGKAAGDALAANARGFLWSAPLAILLTVLSPAATFDARGVALSVVSGAVTSGLGYAIWYRALRGLTATRAAVLQLAVPVLASLGAVLFLVETPNVRLATAGTAVIGGVALTLTGRASARQS